MPEGALNMRFANPSLLSEPGASPLLPPAIARSLGRDANARPCWSTLAPLPRWRSLAALGPSSMAHASMEWAEEVFGCAVWGAAAGRPGVQAGLLCEGTLGHVGFSELSTLRMRRGGPGLPRPREGAVFLWFVESGTLSVELDDGDTVHHGAGALLLSDGAQPLRAHWQQAQVHHLGLPRRRLEEVVGREALLALQGLMPIGHLSLSSFLVAQLQLLKTQGPVMVTAELDESLSLIFGTVDSLLRLALSQRREAVPASEGAERLNAVYRFIDKNLHRHDLNVEQIALGVNSSRAQLYRLFQAQPLSVHATLREARLLKSVEYLRHCGDKLLSIGAIAYACGFSDQSVFSKLFRQRFGLTPSELRNGQGAPATHLT